MDYDFYIVTRFDLWLGVPIEFNFNKFNFLFKELDWWDNHNCTTDTFYFPKSMLEGFVKGIVDCRNNNGSTWLYRFVSYSLQDLKNYIEPSEYHYIDEEKQTVQISKNIH